MDDEQKRRLQGLRKLLHDGVKVGADYVQSQHHRAMEVPYRILESLPGVAAPTKVVHQIHRSLTDLSYDGVRLVNQWLDQAGDVVIAELEGRENSQAASGTPIPPMAASTAPADPKGAADPEAEPPSDSTEAS